ncbi:MAG: glycosyltransferase [Candidatus Niyogibacteria bacterium]|nr:glycosyltransferase [Candidatus Niyogibacteria bacterium]
MKVLSISSDRNIFNENSEVRQRTIEYGRLAEELHIIVFTKRKLETNPKIQISENTFFYPTDSFSRWSYIFNAVKIAKKIIGNYPDKFLVTSQDPFETGLAGWLIARQFNFPLQLQIHTDFLSSYFRRESFLNKIRVWLAKFLIFRAACLRVVSERIKKSLAAIGYPLNFVTVLPIFVDVGKIKNAPIKTDLRQKYPQFDFIILTASRLTREKNIGLAVEVMAEIIKEYPQTGLIIVGNGPEELDLKFKIKNLKLEENVILEDWTEDLASYYKTADLFLLTSNYEGYGRTLIEAVFSGCGAISANVGIADEILAKENIFEPDDKKALVEKITKAMKGELLQIKFRAEIRTKDQYLEKYKKSWETCSY